MVDAKYVMNRISWTSIIIGLVILSAIFAVEFVGFCQEWKHFSLNKPNSRWRLPLLLATSVALISMVINVLYEFVNWKIVDSDICENILPGVTTFFFILPKQFVNLFLFDRAKVVHETLNLKRVWNVVVYQYMLWETDDFH